MHKYINELSKEKTFVRYQGDEISLNEEWNYLKEQLEKEEKISENAKKVKGSKTSPGKK